MQWKHYFWKPRGRVICIFVLFLPDDLETDLEGQRIPDDIFLKGKPYEGVKIKNGDRPN